MAEIDVSLVEPSPFVVSRNNVSIQGSKFTVTQRESGVLTLSEMNPAEVLAVKQGAFILRTYEDDASLKANSVNFEALELFTEITELENEGQFVSPIFLEREATVGARKGQLRTLKAPIHTGKSRVISFANNLRGVVDHEVGSLLEPTEPSDGMSGEVQTDVRPMLEAARGLIVGIHEKLEPALSAAPGLTDANVSARILDYMNW